MSNLFELAKIEKYQLDWFLQSLRSLKWTISSDVLDKAASIQALLDTPFDPDVDSNVEDEHDMLPPRTSSIDRARDDILTVYTSLISEFKFTINKLNDELEDRNLDLELDITPAAFNKLYNDLYAAQKKAEVCKSTEKTDLDCYALEIQSCLADMFPLLVEINSVFQSTNVWDKAQLDHYLSELDLDFIDGLIDLVEGFDESRYEKFCMQYDDINDLPYTDLVRVNLTSMNKEIMNFFRDSYQAQCKKMHETFLPLADASAQYKQLEAASMLDVPRLVIRNDDGRQKEDFLSTPLRRIKDITQTFKNYLLFGKIYFSIEHNLFPDNEMTPLADFSRINCRRFIEEYKRLREERLDSFNVIMGYSSVSDKFKFDMQNAVFLSSVLSPWRKASPMPAIGTPSNYGMFFVSLPRPVPVVDVIAPENDNSVSKGKAEPR
ncbi:MAG: hypothetical protein ACYC0J_07415 [Gammaproteobacteria bacterium]